MHTADAHLTSIAVRYFLRQLVLECHPAWHILPRPYPGQALIQRECDAFAEAQLRQDMPTRWDSVLARKAE